MFVFVCYAVAIDIMWAHSHVYIHIHSSHNGNMVQNVLISLRGQTNTVKDVIHLYYKLVRLSKYIH